MDRRKNHFVSNLPATGLTLGSNSTGKTSIAIATSADASGYGYIQSISSFGTAYGNMAINPNGGNVGIGTASPQANLHIQGLGVSTNANSEYSYYGAIIQANSGSRSATIGAELEFVIPANTDGSNPWGQGRIITVAGNGNNGDATGKMILGTRRMFDKVGAGASWYYGDDITVDGHGYVGIGTTTPSTLLDVAGTASVRHLKGNSGTPTISYIGSGAGTSPTITISGTDTAGIIHVVTGTSPAANSIIVEINFAQSYNNAAYVIIAPQEATQFAGTSGVCAGGGANPGGFMVLSGNTALGSGISYYFAYHVIG